MLTLRSVQIGAAALAVLVCAGGIGFATETAANATPATPQVVQPEARAKGGRVPEVPAPAKTRTIRCWQYGVLLFEEPIVGAAKVNGPDYHLQRPNDPQGLQLIDLRGGGVCLIG